ncbi:hypothetical protein THAOC_02789 [Thalassiosira oceanica]|uniref:Uncharacterized protein n=1 Tax=Thalassiosira oceanica TaxID=159749 RepID=K0TLP3_THAOC|nr:hypothetical protein THAOC_02789 [Thalassiosira oceanica]|eukprot:EJK75486.1 hypothetical protein THAOC_02789 [Thalassiosira oceanica]
MVGRWVKSFPLGLVAWRGKETQQLPRPWRFRRRGKSEGFLLEVSGRSRGWARCAFVAPCLVNGIRSLSLVPICSEALWQRQDRPRGSDGRGEGAEPWSLGRHLWPHDHEEISRGLPKLQTVTFERDTQHSLDSESPPRAPSLRSGRTGVYDRTPWA